MLWFKKKQHLYCHKCGSDMIEAVEEVFEGYDIHTGKEKRTKYSLRVCSAALNDVEMKDYFTHDGWGLGFFPKRENVLPSVMPKQ